MRQAAYPSLTSFTTIGTGITDERFPLACLHSPFVGEEDLGPRNPRLGGLLDDPNERVWDVTILSAISMESDRSSRAWSTR
jgi:hypothetical protein